MNSITVLELKSRFAILPVADLGDCVVVPGIEFDPDWEVYLSDQGHKCEHTTLDGHPVTLVQLKPKLRLARQHAASDRPIYHRRHWDSGLDKLLLQRWGVFDVSQEKRAKLIAGQPEFSGRSAKSIWCRAAKLLKNNATGGKS